MEEEVSAQMPDEEKIQCKNCYWAKLVGITNESCAEFKRKPYKVLYENESCPKFRETQKSVK